MTRITPHERMLLMSHVVGQLVDVRHNANDPAELTVSAYELSQIVGCTPYTAMTNLIRYHADYGLAYIATPYRGQVRYGWYVADDKVYDALEGARRLAVRIYGGRLSW